MEINPITDNISFSSRKQFKKRFPLCAYSGEKFERHDTATIEHIIPQINGGENDYANYLVVKRSWNMDRSDTPLDEYLKENPNVEADIIKTVSEHDGEIIEGINWAEEVKKTLTKAIGRDIFKK